jgi:peptidoglycan/xylan/chitin deacetylase (PgdA/CDA1 family)
MTVVPILLYHSISHEPAGWIAPFSVTPAMFARHVDLISDSGRTAMTVSDLAAALGGGEPLPPRPVLLTFDDGFADFIAAAEVLAARKFPSTLFVTTGALSGGGARPPNMAIPPAEMLDWSQVGELHELHVEVGAHTHTHRQLDIMGDAAVSDDLRRSKGLLEDALGRAVPSFAYPHGFHRGRTRRVVKAVGHTSACAVMNAFSSDSDRVFSLARLTVRNTTTPEQLTDWLACRGARVAPYRGRPLTTAWRWYRRARGSRSARGVVDLSAGATKHG